MKRTAVGAIWALVALCTSSLGLQWPTWTWSRTHDSVFYSNNDLQLTVNSGSHAVAMGDYGDGYWLSVPVRAVASNGDVEIIAYEWDTGQHASHFPLTGQFWWGDYRPWNACVAANNSYRLWLSVESLHFTDNDKGRNKVHAKSNDLTTDDPGNAYCLTEVGHGCNDYTLTGICFGGTSPNWCVVCTDNYQDGGQEVWGLHAAITTNAGGTWTRYIDVTPEYREEFPMSTEPSLAVNDDNGTDVYLVYNDPGYTYFEKSTNLGASWYNTPVVLGEGQRPCIAAVGAHVFVCWQAGNKIVYRISPDGGTNWYPNTASPPTEISAAGCSFANVSAVADGDKKGVLLVYEKTGSSSRVMFSFGLFVDGADPHIAWSCAASFWPYVLSSLRPSVTTMYYDNWSKPIGATVCNVPGIGGRRGIDLRMGEWDYVDVCPVQPPAADATGRLIARASDGSVLYAATNRPHVVSGPAGDELVPILVGPGSRPALALDGDGQRWVSYLDDDTVWCMFGDGSQEVVFAGSSSAVPGQPSIVCYPGQAGGVYVGNVVFAVYDTAGGTSKIMYCRVDTGQVVQDTIESVNNLRDSLPSISVYATDTLLVTFQHGDSVLSVMLADYGPGTAGQVPAWTSPSLVTANGYHPMNVMENGSVLNCVWTQKSGNYYSIQRATNDLASAMFGNWTGMATPGSSTTLETGNSVYAGVGVSVYHQKDANGTWTIKGFVRGEETTLVANDTDACHPHAVAESSAVSPSIDRIALHLLYDAGVAFEVDSGVYDTGEVRYSCLNFDVSHAGSDATKCNNGNKLLRKADGDSLFAVYSDADGAVAYAWSAAGDSWQREIMATGRDYPAIAEDSSGMRWVVITKPVQGMYGSVQEAYYLSGGSWVGPETLYTNAVTTLGPASLAGASDTSTGIAYAAFLTTSGMSKSVILAKFNGSTVSTYTVATGASLGDPSLTVEPYLADSDRVHIVWEDNGIVYYRMDTDGRSSGIASNWTQTIALSDIQATSQHPSINSDRDQIVVAWAQGSPTDVYSRKRSTASAYNNWEAAVNLSNTAQAPSDWPVIAMGDTVVVAWEEQRTGGSDFDILACIDFGDTLNIADNATFSTYPHVLFQNKASGDTAIPYLHTIWSECPAAEYYEVGYNKLNLKQATGEGQQSAGTPPIPVKPSLAACRPNPFRDRTQISYALPTASNVSLRVYDVTGRTVRTLASGFQKAGSYSVSWDSKDSRGRQVPRGVYFYRLDTPGFRAVKKAVVTR